VQQVATLYPNYVQIVTTEDSGIETIEDLVGKRVAVGDQNSGVEVNARNLLAGHGITYDDIQVDYLGYAEAADGLKSGAIDAAFLTSGLPNASVLELSKTLDIKMVSVDPANIEKIAKDQPYFVTMEIPADTYGNAEAVPTAAIMNALVVSSDLSEEDVYKLTKSFFDNLETLGNAHQAATEVSLEAAQEGMVAPVHPGAKKYYDEQ
jgi:TRAP transporter TAXI family solute receptor